MFSEKQITGVRCQVMKRGRRWEWNAMPGSLAPFLWSVPGSGSFEVGSIVIWPGYWAADLDASVETYHGGEVGRSSSLGEQKGRLGLLVRRQDWNDDSRKGGGQVGPGSPSDCKPAGVAA